MRKIITIIIFSIICFGCSKLNPKDALISKAESELKKTMHDPSSYEFVSFDEDLKKESDEKIEYEKLNIKVDYRLNARYYKLTYRGKNMMGALILNDIYVVASDDKDLRFIGLENK